MKSKTRKMFKKFLINQGCFEAFKHALRKDMAYIPESGVFKAYCSFDHLTKGDAIICAFDWSVTGDNHNFWYLIHQKWMAKCGR